MIDSKSYTMINPHVSAVQFDGTEDNALDILAWVRQTLDDDRIDVDFSDLDDDQVVAYFIVDGKDPNKDLKTNPTDWLVAKQGVDDDLFRIRIWKDENFSRTFEASPEVEV